MKKLILLVMVFFISFTTFAQQQYFVVTKYFWQNGQLYYTTELQPVSGYAQQVQIINYSPNWNTGYSQYNNRNRTYGYQTYSPLLNLLDRVVDRISYPAYNSYNNGYNRRYCR